MHKVVTAAAANGAVLPIPPPALNSTYDAHFFGPSLKCRQLPEDQMAPIRENVATITGTEWNENKYTYLSWAWVFGTDDPIGWNLPFEIPSSGKNVTDFYFRGDQQFMQQIGSFYIAVIPEIWRTGASWRPSQLEQVVLRSNLIVLQCGLSNHSYQVSFNYTNGEQYVHIGTDGRPDQAIDNTTDRAWIQAPIANTTESSNCNEFDYASWTLTDQVGP